MNLCKLRCNIEIQEDACYFIRIISHPFIYLMQERLSATKIRIFISSPSDVSAERDVLEDLIKNDLQLTLGREKNLFLEPVRWETHARPAIGDIQSNIFTQLGHYDIFVGVFWKRFGTPTGNYESGSELEFRDAYKRWEEDNHRPVMMYFCDRKIDLDVELNERIVIDVVRQAQKVKAFRQEIESKGLCWTFTDTDELRLIAFRHLYDAIQDLIKKNEELSVHKENSDTMKSSSAPQIDLLEDLPSLPDLDLPSTPYCQVYRFTKKEAPIFFGRAGDIRAVYEAITGSARKSILLLYGESGVGKSSLLDAGVLPRLELVHEVLYLRRRHQEKLVETLARGLNTSVEPKLILAAWKDREQKGRPLTVIFDQVEEVYTNPLAYQAPLPVIHTPIEWQEFLIVLREVFLSRDSRPKGRMMLSFRKEWLADFENSLIGMELLSDRIYIKRLDRKGILEVIYGPAVLPEMKESYRLEVEDNLAETIATHLVSDRRSPIAPTLSILLSKMWERARATGSETVRFDHKLYEGLSREGFLLDDFVQEELDSLKKEWIQSGLALDVYMYHTTELGTAQNRTQEEINEHYRHVLAETNALIQASRKKYLLISLKEDAENTGLVTRLSHDTLAPLIQRRFRASNAPGQRAERVLTSRLPGWSDGGEGLLLDRIGLQEIDAGRNGMRALTSDEERLVDVSKQALMKRRFNLTVGAAGIGVTALVIGMILIQFMTRFSDCSDLIVSDKFCRACIDQRGDWRVNNDIFDTGYCEGARIQIFDLDSDFVKINSGTFMMGEAYQVFAEDEELPVHEVEIDSPYFLGRTEVTQAQWYAVMQTTPSDFKGADLPVERVSWEDANIFLDSLNIWEGCKGCYQLPSEMEWEYAARAGTKTGYSFGDHVDSLQSYAWYRINSNSQTHPVGKKLPNSWGLYDMHGNVYEWVESRFEPYPGSLQKLNDGNVNRVIRGGSFRSSAKFLRSGNRGSMAPIQMGNDTGFRIRKGTQ